MDGGFSQSEFNDLYRRLPGVDSNDSPFGLVSAGLVELSVDALAVGPALCRSGIDLAHVGVLAELPADQLPPIVVHRATQQVIDGAHRLAAAQRRGDTTISAHLLDGPLNGAFALSVSINGVHGKPLSRAERVAAGQRLLADAAHLSDRYVAAVTGLSPRTIARLRTGRPGEEGAERSSADESHSNARLGLDGRVRRTDVSQGRRRAGELMAENPGASLREIARLAGISLGTAHDVKRRLRQGQPPLPPGPGGRAVAGTTTPAVGSTPQTGPAAPRPTALQSARSLRAAGGSGREQTGATGMSSSVLDAPDPVRLLEQLRRDPALRFSATGRALLRLLTVNEMDASFWAAATAHLPRHAVGGVVTLARRCAVTWSEFADRVEVYAAADLGLRNRADVT